MRKSIFLLALFLLVLPNMFSVYQHDSTTFEQWDQSILSDGEGWLTGWKYRKQFTFGIDVDVGAVPFAIDVNVEYGSGSDAANVVYLGSKCQTDFDDIRFTTVDGSTQVDYWREEYTVADDATFWVNYTLPAATPEKGYIYYGRSVVSTTSNGTNTFIMFEDWANENADNWDTTTATHGTPDAATWDDTYADSGSVLRLQGGVDNAGAGWIWDATEMHMTTSHAFIGRVYAEETITSFQRIYVISSYTSAAPWTGFQTREGVESFLGVDDDSNTDTQPMDNDWCDTWTTFQIYRDGTNARLYWRNGIVDTLEETASMSPDSGSSTNGPYIYCRDTEYDLYVDWLAVRLWAGVVEPYFYNWQSEEEYEAGPEIWHNVGEVILYFITPFDYWALNMMLIFGGLVIMIFSVCILAKKVRDKTITRDAGILLLFLFFVGWGLFIGGAVIG